MSRGKPWELKEFLSTGERAHTSYLATKRWRENNPERHKEMNAEHSRKWREEHPDSVRKVFKAWYAKNRDKVLAQKKKYYQMNKEHFKKKAAENYKKQTLVKLSPKCLNCESILKFEEITVCNWCTKTYNIVS